MKAIERQKSIHQPEFIRVWLALTALLCALLCVNQLHIGIIDAACLGILLVMVLVFPMSYVVSLYAFVFVYGYSQISLSFLGWFSLDISQIKNYLCLLIVLRYFADWFFMHRKVQIGKQCFSWLCPLLYCGIVRLYYLGVSSITVFLSCTLAALVLLIEVKKPYVYSIFIRTFLVAEIGEIAFGFTNRNLLPDSGWRAFQFGGVYDPNNCAIHLCLLLSILLLGSSHISKKWRIIAKLAVGIFVVMTISFSGMCLYVSILAADIIFKDERIKGSMFLKKCAVFMGIVLLLFFVLGSSETIVHWLLRVQNSTINSVGQRFSNMLHSWQIGDLDGFSTGRTALTAEYWALIQNSKPIDLIFGNPVRIEAFQSQIGSSHNAYLDLLGNFGIIGLVLFVITLVLQLTPALKKSRTKTVIIVLLFFTVAASRSIGLESMIMYCVVSRCYGGNQWSFGTKRKNIVPIRHIDLA